MKQFFNWLFFWVFYCKSITYVINDKYQNCSAFLHTSLSLYLLTHGYEDVAILNSISYYTNDVISIVHSGTYDIWKKAFFIFHHIVSIHILTAHMNTTNRDVIFGLFMEVEKSNIMLYVYYFVSKMTRDKTIMAFVSTVEAAVYTYYRIGMIITIYKNIHIISDDYVQCALTFGLYVFGVYSSVLLTSNAVTKIKNMILYM